MLSNSEFSAIMVNSIHKFSYKLCGSLSLYEIHTYSSWVRFIKCRLIILFEIHIAEKYLDIQLNKYNSVWKRFELTSSNLCKQTLKRNACTYCQLEFNKRTNLYEWIYRFGVPSTKICQWPYTCHVRILFCCLYLIWYEANCRMPVFLSDFIWYGLVVHELNHIKLIKMRLKLLHRYYGIYVWLWHKIILFLFLNR